MNVLFNLKIGQRLALGFGVILLMLVGIAAFALTQANKLNHDTVAYGTNIVPSLKLIYSVDVNLNMARRYELRALADSSGIDRKANLALLHKALQKAQDGIKQYESLVSDATDKSKLSEVASAAQAYLASIDKVDVAATQSDGDPTQLTAFRDQVLGESFKTFKATSSAVEAWWAYNETLSDSTLAQSNATYSSVVGMIIGFSVISLILGIGGALLITRSITQPLIQAVQVAETVAAGNLSSRIEVQSKDETGQLLGALKRMNDNLAKVVGQVRHSSDSIATGTTQIASGNADLSQRTEEQASNLQQTAASMEQLSATVKHNADTAHQAVQIASSASSSATAGGQVVTQVISTMGDISASSRKIADIIGVIDGIAFQTNILALNAAVEAARAGEQGRGFAVVAGEVRTLAQRSANAAKEIKTLINESVDKVENGSGLVNEAGRQMEDIVVQVKRVTDMIAEIASATNEQSTGIGQVSDAVNQLDQVTQQNAALVEEAAAASESLRHQAHTLSETVAIFKL
jgi:methyl-accepting chemotaxis protein